MTAKTSKNQMRLIRYQTTRNAWGQVKTITKTYSNGKKTTK